MTVSKKALVFIIFVLMFSVFVANLSYLITVNVANESYPSELLHLPKFDSSGQVIPDHDDQDKTGDIILADSAEHIIWFLQISDLHISIFQDLERVTEFKEFCDLTLNAIRPSVVLASGDLTDAKTADNMGSRQFIEEWKIYKGVLDEYKIVERTVWLDLRGNHDNFNVPSQKSKENYYRNFSVQGGTHPKSYLYQTQHGGETYSFIAVDACLDPGPRRPFNFVGVLTQPETNSIKQLLEESRRNKGNYTIWFGHYPTSCILAPGEGGVRAIIGKHPESLVYLCGHFHMLGGAVPNMYTLQHAGFLELELGDWKDNRMYRLGVVDHGMFSFVDVRHRSWPVALVTNPKHALYKMPSREPLKRINQSTHIRILAFSLSAIISVKVRIDDNDWKSCMHIKGPLYVSSWNPEEFQTLLHDIHVHVKDDSGREVIITQPFSLDGSRLNFSLLSRFALMCNLSMLFQFLFGTMLFLCIIPLCVLRCLHKLVIGNKIKKRRISTPIFRWWIRKLWILSSIDRIFYPLVLYPLYLTIGPWSIGEVIEGHTGIIFAWGTVVKSQYLPGSFTYLYGFIHMCTFQFPLTMALATCLERRFILYSTEKHIGKIHKFCQDIPFFIIIALQMILAYFFWLAYGTMAFLLGPMRTWSSILAAILWYLVVNLPDTHLRESAIIWKSVPDLPGLQTIEELEVIPSN